jgi:hypothetical protein
MNRLHLLFAPISALAGLAQDSPPVRGGRIPSMRSLLDALVRLRARMEPKELAPWWKYRELQVPLLILMARAPDAHVELLGRIVDAESNDSSAGHWTAACCVLATVDPGRAAAAAVHCASPRVTIELRDRWRLPLDESDSAGRTMLCGNALQRVLTSSNAGFPPLPIYALRSAPGPGVIPLVKGTPFVGWSRSEAAQERSIHRVGWGWSREENGVLLLSRLSIVHGLRVDTPVAPGTTIGLVWRDRARFLAEARERVSPLRDRWLALLAALRTRGWITEEDAEQAATRFVIEIEDYRQRDFSRLPELRFE